MAFSSQKSIYIGNLSNTTNKETLFDLFSQCGIVIAINLKSNGVSRYGLIDYETVTQAISAVKKMDGQFLDGRQLRCILSRSTPVLSIVKIMFLFSE